MSEDPPRSKSSMAQEYLSNIEEPLLRTRHRSKSGEKAPHNNEHEMDQVAALPNGRQEEVTGDTVQVNIPEPPQLFCQMDVLYHFQDGDMTWWEAARWIKFEERVEVGKRWSKPYVATLSLHALFELRNCMSDGTVLLDVGTCDLMSLANLLTEELGNANELSQSSRQKVLYILTRQHQHQHRKAESKRRFSIKGFLPSSSALLDLDKVSQKEVDKKKFQFPELPDDGTVPSPENKKYKPNKRFNKKLPKGSVAANILIGDVDFLERPIMAFVRLESPTALDDMTEVDIPTKYLFVLLGPPGHHSIWQYEEVGRAVANLLIDQVFREVVFDAVSREDLLNGIDEYIDDLTVLPPSIWDPTTRLEPPSGGSSVNMSLRQRRQIASRERHVTLNHSVGDGSDSEYEEVTEIEVNEEGVKEDKTLKRTGRLFGGMVDDIKRRYPLYLSDIRDAVSPQCIASVVFLYFACITPIVTFGGLLGDSTKGYMGTMECILSGCICGIVYHLFAGQPLTIIGATGPLLVFESILFTFCSDYSLSYLPFRFWIGLWAAVFLMLVVMFDLSALVRYISRFTEECFSVLISIIFIYEAFSKQFYILKDYPVRLNTATDVSTDCFCLPQDCPILVPGTNSTNDYNKDCIGTNTSHWLGILGKGCVNIDAQINVDYSCLDEKKCLQLGGNLTGSDCYAKEITHAFPDVFFFSLYLFLGTFVLAYALARFRNASFFPSIVRSTVADFAVIISVVIATGIDLRLKLDTPKLQVPSEFKTTNPNRDWVVSPLDVTYWWLALVSFVPGLLCAILIFLDQQITAVIVNRKENKLKKGHGYHLDLFIVTLLIVLCSLLGLPWFIAATVRTITHVRSLMMESESKAPGEKPHFLGVREQRVTGVCVHILIGVSILMTGILSAIPKSVLYGVFLYMGVTSLRGVQFIERIAIMLMPHKYQPDYVYLRHVPTYRVHIWTFIQIMSMVAMWVVKAIKDISILFPLMILGLCGVRKIMGFIFNHEELEYLDDLSPEEQRRRLEDKQKKDAGIGMHITEHGLDRIEVEIKDKDDVDGELQPMERVSVPNIVTSTIPHTASWKNLQGVKQRRPSADRFPQEFNPKSSNPDMKPDKAGTRIPSAVKFVLEEEIGEEKEPHVETNGNGTKSNGHDANTKKVAGDTKC